MDVLFDVYDSVGGVDVDSAVTVLFDTSRYICNNVSLLSGEINILPNSHSIIPPDNDILLLMAKVTIDAVSGNNQTQAKIWLEVDTGSGYVVVPGTDSYSYSISNSVGHGTAIINTTYQISKLNKIICKFRVRAEKSVGNNSLSTLAQASNFIGLINE